VSAVNELAALSRMADPDGPGEGWSPAVEVRRVVMYGDPIHFQSPIVCLGGGVVLVESRRVRERRLRPQAGCMYSVSHSTWINASCRFGFTTAADLTWVRHGDEPGALS
jgi:hypothetical protein